MRKSLTVDHDNRRNINNGRSRVGENKKDFLHQLSTPMLLINGKKGQFSYGRLALVSFKDNSAVRIDGHIKNVFFLCF